MTLFPCSRIKGNLICPTWAYPSDIIGSKWSETMHLKTPSIWIQYARPIKLLWNTTNFRITIDLSPIALGFEYRIYCHCMFPGRTAATLCTVVAQWH